MAKKEVGKYVERRTYALIGEEPEEGQRQDIYEVPDINTIVPPVDPASYYITSGEGVAKADKLIKDLSAALSAARKFRKKLVKAKGDAKYLETCWTGDMLLVKRKNPKKRKK